MRSPIAFLLATTMILTFAAHSWAQDVEEPSGVLAQASSSDSSALRLYGRLQTLGIMQNLRDDFRNDTRVYLFLKQARVGATATYESIDFHLQFALGGEEEVRAPSPGVALSLLDLSADIPLTKHVGVKIGQFKVPYGRENITDEAFLQFTDPSVHFLGFKLGRDVGIAFHGNVGKFASTVGVFTGGGRDVPIRYIPLELGIPMIVARVGMNDGLDRDILSTQQNLVESGTGIAFFLNALYTKDSKIGHSTVLNVKLADKSLLLNGNWNPYIGKQPLGKSEFWQIGGDAAVKLSGKERGLSGEAEINYGSFKNGYGSLSLFGARAQGAYFTNPFEIALRYAFLRPDDNFGVRNSQGVLFKIVEKKLIQEITAAVSYYVHGNRVKVTAELPVGINVPIAIEQNLGAYPLTEQPDQTTVIPNGRVERQTVVEARLQLQVMFR